MTKAHRKAGVAHRKSKYTKTRDDFPTPPWAVRAFFEHVAPALMLQKKKLVFMDPACGRGHMVKTMRELGIKVIAAEKFDYVTDMPYQVADYNDPTQKYPSYDVMLTNPPYRYTDAFVERALREAKVGVAVLVRTMWLEGIGRYTRLFSGSPQPPTKVVVFSRRMQATHGRIIRKGSAMMSHAWFWFDKRDRSGKTELSWLPPDAQAKLEKDSDYARSRAAKPHRGRIQGQRRSRAKAKQQVLGRRSRPAAKAPGIRGRSNGSKDRPLRSKGKRQSLV